MNLSKIPANTEIFKDENGLNNAFGNISKPTNKAFRCLFFVDRHILLIYHSESRSVCLDIKTALEDAGHTVWIDVESMHGSSLESTSIAIQQSEFVLMCMTEKYKESANCRAVSFNDERLPICSL